MWESIHIEIREWEANWQFTKKESDNTGVMWEKGEIIWGELSATVKEIGDEDAGKGYWWWEEI